MKRTNRATKALEASIDKSVAILNPICKAMCTHMGMPSNFILREQGEVGRARLVGYMQVVFGRGIGQQIRAQFAPLVFESVIIGIFQHLNELKEFKSNRV